MPNTIFIVFVLAGRFDSDLIDILVSLADDPNEPAPQECSQKSGTSEGVPNRSCPSMYLS